MSPNGTQIRLSSKFNLNSHRKECDSVKKIPTVHSKRRRRRRRRRRRPQENDEEFIKLPNVIATTYNNNNNNNSAMHENPAFRIAFTKDNVSDRMNSGKSFSLLKNTFPRAMHTAISSALLLSLFLVNSTAVSANSPCDNDSWWNPVRDKCITCTVCQGDMIPLRPCQLHRDTICGSIYDLKIDWVVLAKTEPNWKERRKSDDLSAIEEIHEETVPMDWQTAALFMAVLACLLFFIVAACILIHHMRQWRRMERRLDQDVEELSTKLMAKLAEVQTLEGGTFFIGSADALQVPTRFQPQHVLLPAEKPTKHHQNHHELHHERRFLKSTQPGNVYIDNGSKG